MSAELITSVIDEAAVKRQIDSVKAQLTDLKNDIANFSSIKTNIQGAGGVRDLSGELNNLNANTAKTTAGFTQLAQAQSRLVDMQKQVVQSTGQINQSLKQNIEERKRLQNSMNSYIASQKEDLAMLKAGRITRAEYNKTTNEGIIKIEQYKNKIAELNKEIKAQTGTSAQVAAAAAKEAKAIENLNNDYKQLSLAYNEAALKAKNYALQLGAQNPISIKAAADAKVLGDRLKEADASVGQYQRNVGNYAGSIGGLFQKAFTGLRTIANILPGLGLSGLFLAMFEGIRYVVTELGLFNQMLFTTAKQRQLLLDINEKAAESAGKESASLKILRAEIESTNVPMETRLQAVKDLQGLYPDYFAGLTNEQILTGQVGDAYDLAAQAILRKARANAAAAQIEANSSKQLALELKQQLDQAETFDKISKAQAQTRVVSGGTGGVGGTDISVTKEGVQAEIARGYAARRKARDDENKEIGKENDFLLKFSVAGAKETVKIEEQKVKAIKAVKEKAAKEGLDVDFEIFKLEQQRRIDAAKVNVENDKALFQQRLIFLTDYLRERLRLIARSEENELKGKSNDEKLIIQAKYNDQRIRLELEGQNILSDLKKGFDEAEIKNAIVIGDKQTAFLKKAIKEQEDITKKKYLDELKAEEELKKKKLELAKQLAAELSSTVLQIATDNIKREEQELDEKQRKLDENTKRQIANINQLGLSEVERVRQTAAVEKEAQFQTEQIEKRKRALAVERAKFEKAANIATIITTGAAAIIKATATLNPGLIALTSAIVALQLAKAISTPLPKYRIGTDAAKAGMAIYGEAGRELVIPKSGNPYLSPGVATLTSLVGGEKIIPADVTANVLAAAGMGGLAGMDKTKAITADSINSHLMGRILEEIKDGNRKNRIMLKVANGMETSAYYLKNIKN